MSSKYVPTSPRLQKLIARDRQCVAAIQARDYALSLKSHGHWEDDHQASVGDLSYSEWCARVGSCPCCPDAPTVSIIRDQIEYTVCEEEIRCSECSELISYYAYGSTEYAPIGFSDKPIFDVLAPQKSSLLVHEKSIGSSDFDL